MMESKSVAMDRLRKEGRWEEASLWRDQKRKQLRAEGQTRTEANDVSWQAMSEQFPPLQGSGDQPLSPASQLLDINPNDYDGNPDMSRDILWVYENLARSDLLAKDAPSLGAWGLLQWARENRNQFFERILLKAKSRSMRDSERMANKRVQVTVDSAPRSFPHRPIERPLFGTAQAHRNRSKADSKYVLERGLFLDARRDWLARRIGMRGRSIDHADTVVRRSKVDPRGMLRLNSTDMSDQRTLFLNLRMGVPRPDLGYPRSWQATFQNSLDSWVLGTTNTAAVTDQVLRALSRLLPQRLNFQA